MATRRTHSGAMPFTKVVAYVIMPNHIHVILYLPICPIQFEQGHIETLHASVTNRERNKRQIHKVFEESFEVRYYTEKFLFQKMDYIHQNPVQGKWQLSQESTGYAHSSATFYELNKDCQFFQPGHYDDLPVEEIRSPDERNHAGSRNGDPA